METGPSETRASSSASHALDPAGFAPGHILADRYRIVALVGRGGMGEVYRADDLKLDQPVALKFLPPSLEHDPAARDRLLAEVRSARTVSHPNVCRVYDVGDVGGRVFLTMEYIDGEDLASLLRRIGRLPAAKALEVARQLCAGLAAAHDKGVLHRDLKPANVMIDGRGQARITDFGLAVNTQAGGSPADFAGTLPYMAPERFHGTAASVQSDLYGLGLILYETYTGKPAFKASSLQEWERAHADSTPSSPSALTSEIEPAVDRAIMRCLAKDPAKRPASAAQVAAALPGGDPLAAAIAAGETPSPELVAASGEEGTLPRRTAWAVLLAGFLGLVLAAGVLQWSSYANLVPFEGGPDTLRVKARALLRSLGYEQAPRDHAWAIVVDPVQRRVLASRESTAQRFADVARISPTPLTFLYRQSPHALLPLDDTGVVSSTDPAPEAAGDALLCLDTTGRLTLLRVVPPTRDPDTAGAGEPDWRPVLAAAGLADATLTPVTPRHVPPVASDARQAWTGTAGRDEFRFEAAAFRGRVVFAEWSSAGGAAAETREGTSAITAFLGASMAIVEMVILVLVALLARHNARLGRGDRRGAKLVAAFVLFLGFATNLAARHWVPDAEWAWDVISTRLGWPMFRAAFVWLAYLAIEPHARRMWPHILVAWTRLRDGRWRDPLVGQALLAGVLYGTVVAVLGVLPETAGRAFGLAGTEPFFSSWSIAPGTAYIARVGATPLSGVFNAMGVVALLVVVRFALRADRAALAVAAAIVAIFFIYGVRPVALDIVQAVIIGIGTVVFLRRHGLLALVAGLTINYLVGVTPWTLDLGKWFAWRPVLTVVLVAVLAVWGFRNVLGQQSAFPAAALDG